MTNPSPDNVTVPPGEYSVPGFDRILVIEGPAHLLAPKQPTDITLLVNRETPSPAVDPTVPVPSTPVVVAPRRSGFDWVQALSLVAIFAALGAIGYNQFPHVGPSPYEPPPAPSVPVVPVVPPKPAQPDWLPKLDAIGMRLERLELKLAQVGVAPKPVAPKPAAAVAQVAQAQQAVYAQPQSPVVYTYQQPAMQPAPMIYRSCPPGYSCPR